MGWNHLTSLIKELRRKTGNVLEKFKGSADHCKEARRLLFLRNTLEQRRGMCPDHI